MTNVVFFAIIAGMETPKSPNSENQDEPKKVGDILDDIDAVIDVEPDPERVAGVKEKTLGHEVTELRQRRDDIYEVIAGEGNTDPEVLEEAQNATHAVDAAKQELEQATRRHPSGHPDVTLE